MSDFSTLGLAPQILRALDEAGYAQATPIQAGAIPELLNQRDVLGCAQTGTGKTAAFVLPVLQRLLSMPPTPGGRHPRVLILSPTRELAAQIGQSVATYGRYTDIRHTVIFGGVGFQPQLSALRNGVDIIVATPGRLLDIHNQGRMNLSHVEFFVLDEADRMLDMGFVRDIQRILRLLPEQRQNLLFSATMPRSIVDLAETFMHRPVKVEVAASAKPAELIDQQLLFVESAGAKNEALRQILERPEVTRAIIFTRTKHIANRVTRYLENAGIGSAPIHGNKSQNARERALADFRGGRILALVATDVASRGLDIENVSHVINYDLPDEPDSYVHRIGRTARAGADGVAIAFCTPEDLPLLDAILWNTQVPVDIVDVQGTVVDQQPVPSRRPRRVKRGGRVRENRPNVDSLSARSIGKKERRPRPEGEGRRRQGPRRERANQEEYRSERARREGGPDPAKRTSRNDGNDSSTKGEGQGRAPRPAKERSFEPTKKGQPLRGRKPAGDRQPASQEPKPARRKRRPKSPDTHRPNVDPNAPASDETRFRRPKKASE